MAAGILILLGTFIISCKEDKEVLVWNEPPTSADTLYQNPLFEPDLAVQKVDSGTAYLLT